MESGELVAVFIFAFRDEETATDAERDIDDDLGLLVHDPEIEIEGALVIAMSPVKGGDFGLNRLGLLEFIVRERSELTPGPTPEAAPLRSGDDHGEDTLPTPPEKTELKYSNLGSKLDRLIGRIEAGEISALDAAGNAPIHQDESVAVTIYLSGNAKESRGLPETERRRSRQRRRRLYRGLCTGVATWKNLGAARGSPCTGDHPTPPNSWRFDQPGRKCSRFTGLEPGGV